MNEVSIEKLLTRLLESADIGHLSEASNVAEEYLSNFAKVKKTENFLLAEIGSGDYTIMLEAHIDQIGMIVTNISEDGFVSVSSIGSIDTRFLPSTPVIIHGKQKVKGIFTSTPPHLKEGEVGTFDNLRIDTGDNQVSNKISLGDIVTFAAPPVFLKNSRITSASLDNRAGVASIIEAGKLIAEANLPYKVILVFPKGEELGLRGAKVAAFDIDADESISVDVSFGDCPDVPVFKTAKLSSGAMIGISPVLSKNIYDKLQKVAKENNIPYTLEVMGGNTSTDADAISLTKSGIPSGLISVPLRNMHTPCEVADINDINAVSQLIFAYVKAGGLNG